MFNRIFDKINSMKNSILTLLICALCANGFSQNSKFELPARQTPTVKKEKLSEVKLITDLSPLLWNSMVLSSADRYFLTNRRISEGPEPPKYVYPQEKYKEIIDYVSVAIVASCNGKRESAESTSDILTTSQKDMLNSVDPGSNITVTIKYKYKNQTPDNFGIRNIISEGVSTVTVIPDVEAEYPGGFKQLSNYFASNVANKVSEKDVNEKLFRAEVRFTVEEDGSVTNAKVSQTTTDVKVDKLLLEALNNMPKWTPAANSKGVRVKQQFIIPFNVGC